jgi:rubredoxin
MISFVCSVCGYVYDQAENDNIPFAQLPTDWVCPLCGVGKDSFKEE